MFDVALHTGVTKPGRGLHPALSAFLIVWGMDVACQATPPVKFPDASALEVRQALSDDWSEGPVWVASGQYLLFAAANTAQSDALSLRTTIYQLNWPDTLTVFAPEAVLRSNGMAIADNGDLYAAMHDTREIARLVGGQRTARQSVASSYMGLPFNAPNDLAVRHDGVVYFTDPNYEQAGRPGQAQTRVYRIATDGNVHVVDAMRQQPNGIALSVKQDSLYVGDADGVIVRYPVAADGSTGAPQPFASPGSNVDGMAIDVDDRVYVSLYDVQQLVAYAPTGAQIWSVPMPCHISNLAFGGPDRKTLFITCGGSLYSLPMPVAGLPY